MTTTKARAKAQAQARQLGLFSEKKREAKATAEMVVKIMTTVRKVISRDGACMRLGVDPDDIVQEVVAKMIERDLPHFEEGRGVPVEAWATQRTRWALADVARKRQTEVPTLVADLDAMTVEPLSESLSHEAIEERTALERSLSIMDRVIKAMAPDDKDRAIIESYVVYGASRELARCYGMSESTISRARDKQFQELRKRICGPNAV